MKYIIAFLVLIYYTIVYICGVEACENCHQLAQEASVVKDEYRYGVFEASIFCPRELFCRGRLCYILIFNLIKFAARTRDRDNFYNFSVIDPYT